MKKNNKKGFTLVELVIVVAVMAVLVAVAIPTVGSITGSAKSAVQDSNARTIESVIKLAEAEAAKGGDGTATLTAAQIDTAVTAAKLGIEEGTYNYNPGTGAVAFGEGAEGCFDITFDADAEDADDIVTVEEVEGAAPAPTT